MSYKLTKGLRMTVIVELRVAAAAVTRFGWAEKDLFTSSPLCPTPCATVDSLGGISSDSPEAAFSLGNMVSHLTLKFQIMR